MHEAQSSSPGIHYVCIATAQNSVNILPLFTESRYQIKNIKQVTILTSEKGKVKLWTDLLEAFLNDPSLRDAPITVKKLMMADYNTAGHLLAEYLKGENNVVINIGGGVKAIALSIWTYALENNWERGWEMIYPNMEDNCIDVYNISGHTTTPLRSDIKLSQISKLYDHSIRQIQAPTFNGDLANHFEEKQFRMAFYGKLNAKNKSAVLLEDSNEEAITKEEVIEKEMVSILPITNKIRDQLFEDMLKEINKYHEKLKKTCQDFKESMADNLKKKFSISKVELPSFKPSKPDINAIVKMAFSSKTIKSLVEEQLNLKSEFEINYNKFVSKYSPPIYFERILQKEVLTYIESTKTNVVLESFRNVEIIARDVNNNDGEHDILLNLYNGQLISLDAKTFSSDPKDLFSRIKRLENLAGIYTRFAIIIPYFWEDFSDKNIAENDYLKKLQVLPFFFDTHQISFCVYNHTAASFYLTQTDNGIIKSHEPSLLPNQKSVKIQHYTHFLNQLLSIPNEKNKVAPL
ncbi:MAG: hypothetical protein KA340_13475 [Saprospiraceae bacterium]|jgi:hypothetical protein|nr:hypothetical protein [Saprospiraceae bacterium]